MRKVVLSPSTLNEIKLFKSGNQKLVFRIFELISDIQSNPFAGLGKPKPLKENYRGCWSRRINDEHRLIYKVSDEFIEILSCYGHYEK